MTETEHSNSGEIGAFCGADLSTEHSVIGHASGWNVHNLQGAWVWTAFVGSRNYTGTATTEERAREAAQRWIERERTRS